MRLIVNMKKNYNYNGLTSKYQLISEAHLNYKKEMFKEECWDAASNGPVAECWNEFGQIKQECWSSQPGAQTMTEPGYAGAAGGDSISEAIKKINELRKSFKVIQEQYAGQSSIINSLLKKDQERLTSLQIDLEVVKSEIKN